MTVSRLFDNLIKPSIMQYKLDTAILLTDPELTVKNVMLLKVTIHLSDPSCRIMSDSQKVKYCNLCHLNNNGVTGGDWLLSCHVTDFITASIGLLCTREPAK